jgi:hypothetical protein
VDDETVPEARSFDLEVLLQEFELFLQLDLLDAQPVEREPQEVAEARQHGVGGLGIAMHQR